MPAAEPGAPWIWALNLGQSLLLVPFLLSFWQAETYGLWIAWA